MPDHVHATDKAAVSAEQWWLRQRAEYAARTAVAAAPAANAAALPTAPAADNSPWWVRQSRQLAARTAAKGERSRGYVMPAGAQRPQTPRQLAAPQPWRVQLHSSMRSAISQEAEAAAAAAASAPAPHPVGGAGTAGSSFTWARGRLGPASAELAAALGPLATLCNANHAALARAVACLPPGPLRRGVVQHGSKVAAALLRLGVQPPLLTCLLRRCLLLFARPPEEHAVPLLAHLAAVGLLPAEAARCLERCPAVAGAASLQPGLLQLGQLLAEGQDGSAGLDGSSGGGGSGDASSGSGGGSTAEQRLRLAGALLREQPAAAQLLCAAPSELRRRAAHLRCLGLGPAELAAALQRDALLLAVSPADLSARAEALDDELGGGPAFFAALLAADPTVSGTP